MQNYQSPGEVVEVVAPYALASGAGCKVGAIFGAAMDDSLISVAVRLQTEGVLELVKDAGTAWAVGDKVYWDDSAKECDVDSAAGMLIGYCVEIAASDAVVGKVKLIGRASDLSEGPQAAEAALSGTLTGTANGSMVDVAATASAVVGGATPTAAQVDTGIALAVSTIVSGTNEQLKELQTKLNALLAKLVLAGILDA